VITPEHLGLGATNVPLHQSTRAGLRASTAERGAADTRAQGPGSGPADPDRAVVEEALTRAGGIVSKAAAELGVSRQALYRRMERAGVVLERRPKI
jgi:transcriptional regulator of acetoin/glycerol metabolism